MSPTDTPGRLETPDVDESDNEKATNYSSLNEQIERFFGGTLTDIAVDDLYAHLAVGQALHTLDVSDPTNPRLLNTLEFGEPVKRVYIRGTTLYVSAFYSGLHILDFSSPKHLSTLGIHKPSLPLLDMAIKGDYAYILTSSGIEVIDISSSPPQLISRLENVSADRLSLSGNQLFAYDTYNLNVVDVSDPHSLQVVAYTEMAGLSPPFLTVDGCYAYHAADDPGSTGTRLEVIDVCASTPFRVGRYSSFARISSIHVRNTHAFVANGDGLVVLDVKDPPNPTRLGTLDLQAFTQLVNVHDNLAYVGSDDGVRIVDISDPSDPVLLVHYDTLGAVEDVFIAHVPVYLASGISGLRVGEFDESGDLKNIGYYQTTTFEESGVYSKGFQEQNAFVTLVIDNGTAYVGTVGNGLQIFDVEDRRQPILVSEWSPANVPAISDIAVEDGIAYLATSAGLYVVGVSDLEQPEFLGRVPGRTFAVEKLGHHLFVASGPDGLSIVDVEDPVRPRKLSRIGSAAFGVALTDKFLYIANSGGLEIFEMEAPDLLHKISVVEGLPSREVLDDFGQKVTIWREGANPVAASEADVFFATHDSRVWWVDVSTPEMPRPVGFFDPPPFTWSVRTALTDDFALIASKTFGLGFLPLNR